MLSHYEPDVKATIVFLKLMGVKVNGATVNKTLQAHPSWPSLLSVSDALHVWNIPNAAGKIRPDSIDDLPVPFIAYINDQNFPLVIVKDISDTSVKLFAGRQKKFITQSKEDFLKSWTGIYLLAEPTFQSGEKDYAENMWKVLLKSTVSISLFVLAAVLSFFFIYRNINSQGSGPAVNQAGIYIEYFILAAGVIFTILLLWSEIDHNNPFLQKVCTGIAKGDCNAILTSKHAKIFKWLSWSEIGFFYFSGGLLMLLFSSADLQNSIIFLAWLNVLTIPYTIFSVYYQWRVAKQWCILCLAVQLLFISGTINAFANNLLVLPSSISFFSMIKDICLYLLPVLAWYTVKSYILDLQQAKKIRQEYMHIKFNTEIFETLLKKQKAITIPPVGLGIDLGKPEATNTLVKVCNPYCGPCSKVHPKIEKLLEANANLKVQVIFTTPDLPDEPGYKPVSHLLAIADQQQNIIKDALDDWYLADKKDYESFAAKYPMNGELSMQGEKIRRMEKWCKETGIQYTPTLFFNGYQIPEAYNIEDLAYFLLK